MKDKGYKLLLNSITKNTQYPIKKENKSNKKYDSSFSQYKRDYLDSFAKQSEKSAPILMGLSSLSTVLEMKEKNLPVKKAMKNVLMKFYFPILIISSGIIAGIEVKKNNKTK